MTTPSDLGTPLEVEQVDHPVQHAAFLQGHVAPAEIAAFLGRAFAAVAAAAGARSAQLTGPPFARYTVVRGGFDIRAGFPVDQVLPAEDGVECALLPGGPALRVLHVGAYEDLGTAYQAAEEWLTAHHMTHRGDPWCTCRSSKRRSRVAPHAFEPPRVGHHFGDGG
jgi:hypothetical protein